MQPPDKTHILMHRLSHTTLPRLCIPSPHHVVPASNPLRTTRPTVHHTNLTAIQHALRTRSYTTSFHRPCSTHFRPYHTACRSSSHTPHAAHQLWENHNAVSITNPCTTHTTTISCRITSAPTCGTDCTPYPASY